MVRATKIQGLVSESLSVVEKVFSVTRCIGHASIFLPNNNKVHCSDITLQIMPKSVQLRQHEVDVLLCLCLIGDDRPEEVGQLPERLVADHHAPTFHHPALYDRSYFSKLVLPKVVSLFITQPCRDVPENNIGTLWLVVDQVELVWHPLHLLDLVVRQIHQTVNLLFKSRHAPCSPLEPELEDVVMTATLNNLVTRIIRDVIALVSLEKVVRGHLVAADE